MIKIRKLYKGDKLAILLKLHKILKKKHLFGDYIFNFRSPVDVAKDVNSEILCDRHDYRIITNKIRFTTASSKTSWFMKEVKTIYMLLQEKPGRRRTSLNFETAMDVYLEDYFQNNQENLKTKKTYFHYGMVGGLIALMVAFSILTIYLFKTVNFYLLLSFLIMSALYVGYVQCKLCA